MAQETIKCPNCGEIINLPQAISQNIEIEIRQKYEKQLSLQLKSEREKIEVNAKKEAQEALNVEMADLKRRLSEKDKKIGEIQQQEVELRTRERQIKEREENIAKEFEKREKELKEKAKKEAEQIQRIEIDDLKTQLSEKEKRLEKAEQQELEARKKQRELVEKEEAYELEMTRQLDEERQQIKEKTRREFEEGHRLKDAEKDKQLTDMRKQIEDLKRKAEQGSQQTQGEVLELELEELFKREFSFDMIEPVSKGVRGADIVQTVKTQSGRTCGKILWETKRVKNWSESWIQKLKDDQGDAKADIAVLVSEALPAGFHHFRQISGVWVTDIPSALSLALALRMVLIQVANAKEIESGKDDKKDLIYRYVTSPEFRNRVIAIVDGFRAMKEDLEAEKRAMQRIWGNREKQIEKIISNTAGMYGDLEGLAGPALQQIKILELPGGDTKQEDEDK